jgi:hypothetical protein
MGRVRRKVEEDRLALGRRRHRRYSREEDDAPRALLAPLLRKALPRAGGAERAVVAARGGGDARQRVARAWTS